MNTPTDPSEWAMREARDLIHRVLEIGGGWETSEQLVALALDAARRRGIGEAAQVAEPKHKPRNNKSSGEHGRIAEFASKSVFVVKYDIARAIRALADKEPT